MHTQLHLSHNTRCCWLKEHRSKLGTAEKEQSKAWGQNMKLEVLWGSLKNMEGNKRIVWEAGKIGRTSGFCREEWQRKEAKALW